MTDEGRVRFSASHRLSRLRLSGPPLGMLRAALLVALVGSVYLFRASLGHTGVAGCGVSAGCGDVLGSRWSLWLGIPVSGLAAGLYVILFLATFADQSKLTRRGGTSVLLIGTGTASLAAVWFVALQFVQLGHLCAYCLAVHVAGLLATAIVWSRGGRSFILARPVRAPAFSVLALLLLIAGQLLFSRPQFDVRAGVGHAPEPQAGPTTGASEAPHLKLIVGDRLFDLNPGELPIVGFPAAGRYVIVMSDYTCEHCRATHRTLHEVLANHRDTSIIVLPVPLDSALNPYIPAGATHPLPQDAALTRLALAVWCARPEAFEEINGWLFAENRVRTEDEAGRYAVQLVGEAALERAMHDPRIDAMIRLGCDLFARAGSGVLPKMIVGSTLVNGAVTDPRVMKKLIAGTTNRSGNQ